MSVYVKPRTNGSFIQFQMYKRTYKKSFGPEVSPEDAKRYEANWKAGIQAKRIADGTDIRFGDSIVIPAYKSTSGFVYVVKSGELFKIGMTKDIAKRMQSIQLHNPHSVSTIMLITTHNPRLVERRLHKQFADKRIGTSEWFRLDEEDIEFLLCLATMKRRINRSKSNLSLPSPKRGPDPFP